jgi:predicted acylesterase/phospholipase RssA
MNDLEKENSENSEKLEYKKNIKHLVIPGGGPTGIISLGALKYLEEEKYWNLDDIESIYATSAGTILALLISMKFEWSMITDYIIKRPWQEAVQIKPSMFFDAYSKKGLFDKNIIHVIFKPFFLIKDWSMEMTMLEFYQATKKELHFFTLEINSFEIFDINYKTFPNLPILTAVHMSSALPCIVSPVFIDGKCYIDGGIICNYPLKNCLENVEDPDSIFAINNFYVKGGDTIIKEESTILDYFVNFMTSMVFSLGTRFLAEPNSIKNELLFEVFPMSLDDLKNTLSDQKKREELFEIGINGAKSYLEKKVEK